MGKDSVRVLKSMDEELILRLQLAILPTDEPLAFLAGPWWVAWVGSEPVGFACLKMYDTARDTGYLARAGVLKAYRGRQIQRKLIQVREKYARARLLKVLVTDTSRANLASSNSLIACGYRLYTPAVPWAFKDGNYWRKTLKDNHALTT
jgi:GNAT superfamily N-acetyltransferase